MTEENKSSSKPKKYKISSYGTQPKNRFYKAGMYNSILGIKLTIKKHGLEKINYAFIAACEHGNLKVIKYLIKKYVNLIEVSNGFRSLCKFGHLNEAKYLVSKHLNKLVIKQGITAACYEGNLDIVIFLEDYCDESDFNSGLDAACYYGRMNVISYLMEKHGYGPDSILIIDIDSACKNGQLDVVKYFIEINVGSINDENINEGFIYACYYGRDNIIKYMTERKLENKLEIYVETFDEGLSIAGEFGYWTIVKYLVEEIKVGDINRLLTTAIDNDFIALAKYALEHGATNISELTIDFMQPLLNKGINYKLLGEKAIPFVEKRSKANNDIKNILLHNTTVSNDVVALVCECTEY